MPAPLAAPPIPAPGAAAGGWQTELRATVTLAWPVVLTQLGAMALGLVDVAMVAPLGAEALAAVSIGNSVHWMGLTVLFGTLLALDPLISQAWGAGERGRVGVLVWQGVWLSIAAGAVAGLASVETGWLYRLLDQPPAVGDLANAYGAGLVGAFIPHLLFTVGRSVLGGAGITKPLALIMLAANLANAAADAALIHGWLGAPALGVYGAGLATTISRWLMAGAIAAVVWRRLRGELDLRPRPLEPARLRRVLALGLPIGLQNFAEFGVFAAAGVFAGWIGAVALAAHQVALSLAAMAFMVPVGVSVATAIRVGHAIGAGRPDAAALAGKVGMALGGGVMACSGAVFLAAPGALASLFGGEAEVIAQATPLLRIAAAFAVVDGVQVVAAGALRGAGDTRTSMLANVLSHWLVGLPLGYALAFPLGLGAQGLWWGLTGSLALGATLLSWLFLRGGWRRIGPVHG
jgi:MATE family multidrug resistance protein